jgi:hypothetical protein
MSVISAQADPFTGSRLHNIIIPPAVAAHLPHLASADALWRRNLRV